MCNYQMSDGTKAMETYGRVSAGTKSHAERASFSDSCLIKPLHLLEGDEVVTH
jgi:hypothetical protein